MSDFWSWFIIVIVVLNLGGCAWLLMANSKMSPEEAKKETTGHSFDGIEERNQPLPRWWLWLFWGTLAFAVIYLVLYPGLGKFDGVLDWSSTQQWENEVEMMRKQSEPIFDEYAKVPVKELIEYPEALEVGGRLFATNCATCHGSDARGARGYPNLTDDAWLYGGSPEAIKTTLTNGRQGNMPPMGAAVGGEEGARKLALYVQSLSKPDIADDPAKAKIIKEAKPKFAACAACHGQDGTGNQAMGAPDLTDDAWLYGSDLDTIQQTIMNGRSGQMPAFGDQLSEERIHVLAAYVYSLSHESGK
jgi:cytochrome c oxidase cbb3-type subunit 3